MYFTKSSTLLLTDFFWNYLSVYFYLSLCRNQKSDSDWIKFPQKLRRLLKQVMRWSLVWILLKWNLVFMYSLLFTHGALVTVTAIHSPNPDQNTLCIWKYMWNCKKLEIGVFMTRNLNLLIFLTLNHLCKCFNPLANKLLAYTKTLNPSFILLYLFFNVY